MYLLKVRQGEIAKELHGWLLTAESSGISDFGRDTIKELTRELVEVEGMVERMT